ncbi:four-carbon acid sugar kinase family protein [Brucella anthropi]|jgi:3-oxoisoapionate kinase|uniref:Four-carbon acid sugar kinase family protein n=1 Tax=Brucella anthropi TaxID=529 RepID=A0A011V022_BRUAN|nr:MULTISPECIES: four-carbon acid sugar kinase family protein [Brucella/Ochrobactrum group]MCR5941430.1 four-carbon acid sugar kinase family protein [Ochrobactrum sp. XJ1]QTN05348.1 four-carbon acid sugar kinase family protein [Ochrobactrum sp. EEELCW01]EXL01775.1 Hrp-dependent type III effector protein [Brucella anthropi]KAB2757259.1 four-carbon acid sugar kinase family protein [Brucella anthropi]KAB2768430.1 four-carbon acid sugar kinase family protein [Brucella anthropi]
MSQASNELLLSYYGDDLTGSTDVMEAMASNGVDTVLFMNVPDEELLSRFSHCKAIGLAGTSRSETPEWMQENLTPAFNWLKSLNTAIAHYKVCSTFDSAPHVGNIGKAVEIGKAIFNQAYVPLIVGAPQLKRYTAFGNLFAAYQGETYRIDRHPVMSHHPVTPMHEADLRVHLAKQTVLKTVLADLVALSAADANDRVNTIAKNADGMLLFDVDSHESQLQAGEQLWRLRPDAGWFVAGSSGVEYALLAAWAKAELIGTKKDFPLPGKADRIAVVSGSVSPTTERQIRHATASGFTGIDLNPLDLLGENGNQAIEAAIADGQKALQQGNSVILNTALGPSADRGTEIDKIAGSRHQLARSLGFILRSLVERESLTRAVIAGGDTSSHALRELHVDALTTLLPLPQTPGSPLCTAHGAHAATNGLQIALKGGQVGSDGYFSQIRDGLTA